LDGTQAPSAAGAPQLGSESSVIRGQSAILAAPTDARLLVDAGPGTGKTYVACHRVAGLIAQGVPPSRIWMISFTRTAVAEIRSRIGGALDDPDDAMGVRIATLDSHAWSLQSGFDADAKLTGSYENNIAATLTRVRSDELLREELGGLRHLVIDEAQDILAVRADLTEAIIDAVDPGCGVTVFADEAQSIYGFSEEPEPGQERGQTLARRLRRPGFEPVQLDHIHRTECPRLQAIFRDVRGTILDWSGDIEDLDAHVREELHRLAHGEAGTPYELELGKLGDDALVLLRRRVDVLSLSNLNGDVPHRLRMSGLPASLAPWLARLLWDYVQPRLSRATFDVLWAERIQGGDAAGAWALLAEVASGPGGVIDLKRLRQVLGRVSPPAIFCEPEFGREGPVLGTIHASKGREADQVYLFLPHASHDEHDGQEAKIDEVEEVHVLFVGATRARRHLTVGQGSGRRSSAFQHRAWRFSKGRIQIEVGRIHDLQADGLAGRDAFETADQAREAQDGLWDEPVMGHMKAVTTKSLGWRFELQTEHNDRVGVLSESFKDEVTGITKRAKRWPPPRFLPHLRSIGVRSLVLRPDDPQLEMLHEPWRTSGFMLAPLLTGFSSAAIPSK